MYARRAFVPSVLVKTLNPHRLPDLVYKTRIPVARDRFHTGVRSVRVGDTDYLRFAAAAFPAGRAAALRRLRDQQLNDSAACLFVSYIMTMTGERISWWDRGAGRVREGSMDEAALFIGALETNDRLEVERIGSWMKGRRAYA